MEQRRTPLRLKLEGPAAWCWEMRRRTREWRQNEVVVGTLTRPAWAGLGGQSDAPLSVHLLRPSALT